ncbi:MAG TPA: methyl-accepting chemotaxis protein [Candidatus Limnocylindrales bacterium]|nr:methyl-accepting chemotaxis protein [Candidatus Limnocylindrales bacterium]
MKLSLKWKLILSIGLLIFVALSLGLWLTVRSIKETELESIRLRSDALANPIKIRIKEVFSNNLGGIEMAAPGLTLECQRIVSSNTLASHCFVFDTAGRILAHEDPHLIGTAEKNPQVLEALKSNKVITRLIEDSYDTFIPILDLDQQQVGTLRIDFPRSIVDEKIRKISRDFVILFIILFGGVLFAGSFLLQRTINKPIQQIVSVARKMAEGDISGRVPVKGEDEISQLGAVFNLLINYLQHIIQQVRQTVEELNQASERMIASSTRIYQGSESQKLFVSETASAMAQMDGSIKDTTQHIKDLMTAAEDSSASIMELKASIEEIAANTENLSTSVELTVTSLEEMNVSIKQIASSVHQLSTATESTASFTAQIDALIKEVEMNASETAKLSERVTLNAEAGTRSVQQTISGIYKIQEVTNKAVEVMGKLSEKVGKIGEILNVIDDVADKTNLLALNAAIIAAQAGEHGKGFAVVADEIKDLAEKTTASTKEISDLIRGVQSETSNAVSVIYTGLEQVKEGVRLANEAGVALTEILNSAKQATDMTRHIARATTEQTKGSKQIKDAIDNMVEMVEQITRATAEQSKGSGQIVQATETMKDMTHQVKRATQEQAQGSDRVVRATEDIQGQISRLLALTQSQERESERVVTAMENIKKISYSNIENISQMNDIAKTLTEQINILNQQIAKFKVS